MDISCNLTTDISHGFFRDISDNNKEKVKAKYCTKCNKLVSTSIFFFDELDPNSYDGSMRIIIFEETLTSSFKIFMNSCGTCSTTCTV